MDDWENKEIGSYDQDTAAANPNRGDTGFGIITSF